MKLRVIIILVCVAAAFSCGLYMGEEKRRSDEAFQACINNGPGFPDCTKRYYAERGWTF